MKLNLSRREKIEYGIFGFIIVLAIFLFVYGTYYSFLADGLEEDLVENIEIRVRSADSVLRMELVDVNSGKVFAYWDDSINIEVFDEGKVIGVLSAVEKYKPVVVDKDLWNKYYEKYKLFVDYRQEFIISMGLFMGLILLTIHSMFVLTVLDFRKISTKKSGKEV